MLSSYFGTPRTSFQAVVAKISVHVIFVLLLAVSSVGVPAQTPTTPAIDTLGVSDTGIRPYGSYDGILEHINLQNNNLNFSVPLVSLPGRNHFDFNLAVTYDSSIWRLEHEYASNAPPTWITQWAVEQKQPQVAIGWGLNWPTLVGSGSVTYPSGAFGDGWTACTGSTTLTLQDGSRHSFKNNAGCPTGYFIALMDSEDTDGMQLNCQDYTGCVATERNGTKIYFGSIASGGGETDMGEGQAIPSFAQKIVDANGNTISMTKTGTNMVFTDTVGRQITVSYDSTNSYPASVSYKDTNGIAQTTNLQVATSTYNAPLFATTTSQTSVNSGAQFTDRFLQSVTINSGAPEQQIYSFSYNGQGELTQIVYPHLGCTSYDYQLQTRLVVEPLPSGYSQQNAVASRGPQPNQVSAGSSPPELFMNGPGVVAKHVSPTGQCNSSAPTTTYTATLLGGASNTSMTVGYPDNTSEVHAYTVSDLGQLENDHGITAQELEVDSLDANGVILKKTQTTFTGPHSWDLPQSITTTYAPATTNQVMKQTMTYETISALYEPALYSSIDSVNNPTQPVTQTVTDRLLDDATQVTTYDYGTGSAGAVLQTVTKTYHEDTDSTVRLLGMPITVVTYDGNQAFKSKFQYDTVAPTAVSAVQYTDPGSTTPRGNLNVASHCADVTTSTDPNSCSQWITTSYSYDSTGNMVSFVDARSNSSYFEWADQWDEGTCAPGAGSALAYITKVTNALGQYSTGKYRSCGGQRSYMTDANRQPTTYQFDSINRLKNVSLPDGGNEGITYNETARTATFTTAITTGESMVHRITYDGIGRHTLTEVVSDPQGIDTTQFTYDGRDRLQFQSNPAFGSASTVGTGFQYDGLSRKTVSTLADGSTPSSDYAQFPCVRSTDEAGKARVGCSDALGRLVKVQEDPDGLNYVTTYQYTASGDLKRVDQWGGAIGTSGERVRLFTYDGLSRLLLACNPETIAAGTGCDGSHWGVAYGYDPNGNVTSRQDAAGVVVYYAYDALNRLTGKIANDGGNTSFTYTYDQGTNGVGRLTSESNGSNATGTAYTYDPMGRVATTSPYYYPTSYSSGWGTGMGVQYDLAGNIKRLSYPDGRVVGQSVNQANELAAVWDMTGNVNGTVYFGGTSSAGEACPIGTPATSCAAYGPSGALVGAQLGNGVSEALTLNSRFQPCHSVANSPALPTGSTGNVFDRTLSYSSSSSSPCSALTSNNGNIYALVDNLQVGRSQGFSYDALNRLTGATQSNGDYSHLYNYDAFGNMLLHDNVHTTPNYSIEPTTNRLLLNNTDLTYISNGWLATSPNHSYGYTYEGYLRYIDGYQTGSYVYNGQGQRTLAVHPTSWNEYVYLNGQTFADMDNTGTWSDLIYANGQKVAKVQSAAQVLELSGTCGNCAGGASNFTLPGLATGVSGYTIQTGDRLVFQQKQVNGRAGLYLLATDASNSMGTLVDGAGDPVNASTVADGTWHTRIVSLNPWVGKQISTNVGVSVEANTPTGVSWQSWVADVEVVSANGVVHSMFTGQPLSGTAWTSGAGSQFAMVADTGSSVTARYYLDDHLGTAQAELNSAGWPLWQGEFTPFGQEIVNGSATSLGQQAADGTSMRYKFTGKERDAESGLDYFGARYYASNMGRWMSPDWSAKEDPVPYSDLFNPQSLNLYSYVNNNPLSKADPDGHCAEDFCIVEGGVSAYFLGAAAIVGVAAVLHTPAGQRSVETFTSAAGASLTANFHAASQLAQNIFSSKNPEASAATAGAKGAVATAEEANKEAEKVLGSGAATGAAAEKLGEHVADQVKGIAATQAAVATLAGAKGKDATQKALSEVKRQTDLLKGHAKDIAQQINKIKKDQ